MTYLLAGMMLYTEIVTLFLAPEIAIPIIIAKGAYEFATGKDLYKTWADDANFKDTHRHAYTEEQLKLSWMERVIGVLPLATVIGLEAREMSEAWKLSKEIRLAEEVSTGAKGAESVEEVVRPSSKLLDHIKDESLKMLDKVSDKNLDLANSAKGAIKDNQFIIGPNNQTITPIIDKSEIPIQFHKTITTLKDSRWNRDVPGISNGRIWENRDLQLPKEGMPYTEWDVNITNVRPNRDADRILKGVDGSIYITNSHYGQVKNNLTAFFKIK